MSPTPGSTTQHESISSPTWAQGIEQLRRRSFKMRAFIGLFEGLARLSPPNRLRIGALLASPEEVRKHLNIQDRRTVKDRRKKDDPVETTDKRAHERRKS